MRASSRKLACFITTVLLTAVAFVAHAQDISSTDPRTVKTGVTKIASELGFRQTTDEVQGSILTIFSYHPTMEWVHSLFDGLEVGFETLPNVELYTEFLDAKRHPSIAHSEAFLTSLKDKYADQQPDVLMISDDPAFELLRDEVSTLFPGVPIVFLGLNNIREDLPANVTGTYEIHEVTPTLDIAMTLTKASGVAVISSTSKTGIAHEHTLEAAIEAYPDIEWVIIRDIVSDDLSALEALPDDWPILPMLGLRRGSADGPFLSQQRTTDLLYDKVPNPMFWSTETLFGHGVVGGHVLRGEVHARQALELAVRILNGTTPSDIPAITETPHELRFDWRELERFGWLDQAPKNAELLFKPQSFVQKHRELLAPLAFAMLGLLGVIATLIWHLRSEKRHARRLGSETQRLATALVAADAGVFEIKADGTTINSDRWLEMFESTDAKTSSPEWVGRLTEKSFSDLNERFDLLRQGSERERLEIELESPSRLINLMLMRDGDEADTASIVGMGTDETNHRRVQQQAAARARLHSLGQLAGGVAHDFNNMLMAIMFNATMIPSTNSADEKDALANSVLEASHKAEALTQRLLTFGRVEEHEEPANADLNKLVSGLHDLLKGLSKGCEVSLQFSDLELLCKVSPPSIDQILTNLVVNAADAMEGKGTIYVETAKDQNENGEPVAVLRVRDDGEGMDKDTIERLFEPFFSTKGRGQGTGLGLSIVYGLVSSSGGTITVDSKKGTGSTFEISWPLQEAA